jgi:hypothetical protein
MGPGPRPARLSPLKCPEARTGVLLQKVELGVDVATMDQLSTVLGRAID